MPADSAETSVVRAFESDMHELESLVQRMEHGEQTLEEALADFERGMTLSRRCQQALDEAEQRVAILLGQHAQAQAEPFDLGNN
ncbi:MAG: exodeoxyribonuclease VII small subunit [Halothiobacillaceae bacterium]|jgi:exodeoxyribonuclease VII small subunit|nr:exodeoxyribonuclease VII small subunit [Halothiobacillaceae bacterium]MDY0049806.1 exodeoxyribonuclease VII small subunit [Halothiobacillaceae bacterium]